MLATWSLIGLVWMPSAAAQSDDVKGVILEAVEPWTPQEVAFDAASIVIVLPQAQVTDAQRGMVVSAVCSTVWESEGAWGDFAPESLSVLNEHAHQGYVFEGDIAQICAEAGDMPSAQAAIYIAGHTRMHTR